MSKAVERALGAALTAAALELVIARLTSGPQPRADVLANLVGWMALGAVPVWAAGRVLREGLPLRIVEALFSSMPMLCISGGVLLTPFYQTPSVEHGLGLVWIALVLGVRFGGARVGPATAWAPEAAAWMGIATFAAWLVEHGETPGFFIALAVLALTLVAGFAGTKLLHMPAVFLAASVVCFAPALPLRVEWAKGPNQAPGPDVVVFSVAGLRADATREGRAFEWLGDNGVDFSTVRGGELSALLSGVAHSTGEALGASPTLAERLAAAGYDTAAIVASDGLEAAQGYGRGYAAWHHVSVRHEFALPRAPGAREARALLPRLLTRFDVFDRPSPHGARHVARWLKELLQLRRIDRPFHLWVHWSDPVTPYLQADQSELPKALALAVEKGELDAADPDAREALAVAYANEVAIVERGLRYAIESLGRVPDRGRVLAFVTTEPELVAGAGRLLLLGAEGTTPGIVSALGAAPIDLLPTLLSAAGQSRVGLTGRDLRADLTAELESP